MKMRTKTVCANCIFKSLRSVEFSVTYFIKDLSVCVEVLIYSTSLFLVTTIMDESFSIVFKFRQ